MLSKQDRIETDLAFFEELTTQKVSEIECFIAFCEYEAEVNEFREWISTHNQIAMSEDYGEDHEHLMVLLVF